MATAKKLPSGSWRVLVYSHTETVINPDGTKKQKRIYESFTSDDPSARGKREAEKMAADWAADKNKRIQGGELTVSEALERYLKLNSNVLSPSTLKGYRSMVPRYSSISSVKLSKLSADSVQTWINDLAEEYSGKYVRNIYGFFTAVISFLYPAAHFNINLPAVAVKDIYIPSDAEITKLLDYFKENDPVVLTAVYFAAFGTMRRSEVCGVRPCDVDFTTKQIHIRQTRVNSESGYIFKESGKTKKSNRIISFPDFVIESLPNIPSDQCYVDLNPDTLYSRYRDGVQSAGLPHFTFHDLRHYSASIMHALGVPEKYIMDQGGWKSNYTLNRVYRQSLSDYQKKYNDMLQSHFSELDH